MLSRSSNEPSQFVPGRPGQTLFPEYGSHAYLTKKRGASCITAFIIICFFAGFGGSYFLENNFGLLTIAVLGIAGI